MKEKRQYHNIRNIISFFFLSQSLTFFSFYIFEARIQETLTYFPCIKRNKIYFAPFYKICSSSVIKMARSCKILWISYVFILYSYFLLATVSLFLSLLLFLLLFLLYDSSNSGRFCIATGNNIAQKKRTKKQELILSFSLFLYKFIIILLKKWER